MEREKITFEGIWSVLKATFTGFSAHKVTELSEVETDHNSIQENAS